MKSFTRPGQPGVVVVLVVVVALATMARGAATDANSAAAAARERVLADADAQVVTVKVVDAATDSPLKGAKVQSCDDQGPVTATTDARGVAMVRIFNKTQNLSLSVTCPKYVGEAILSSGESARAAAELSFRLERGTAIGGVVTDDAGQPIEGVAVGVHPVRMGPDMRGQGSEPAMVYAGDEQRTDKDGRWRSDAVPADMSNIGVTFRHGEYLTSGWYPWGEAVPVAKLRDMTAVKVLERGIRVYGVVRNEKGESLKGAVVKLGETGCDAQATTDGDGRFSIPNAQKKMQVVTVQIGGYAPLLRELPLESATQEQVLVLEPGCSLKVKVVDAAGKPIEGARLSVTRWQGYSSIVIPLKTKASGTFTWKSAPATKMDLQVWAKGYIEAMVKNVVADRTEKVFVLGEPVRVSGKVVDAVTGRPVEKFNLMPAIVWPEQSDMSLFFQDKGNWVKEFAAGQYQYSFDRPGRGYAVKVTAAGYLPAESRVIDPNERNVVCDFSLRKAARATGVVLLSDGGPAAGASVYVRDRNRGLYVQDGKVVDNAAHVTTEADGKFVIDEPADAYTVVCLADAGLAMVTSDELRQSGRLTLQPWGRVEGEYYAGTKPAAGRTVRLTYAQRGVQVAQINGGYDVVVDEQGRFSVARVRPGLASIDGRMTEVTPGETTHVKIGGVGRTVKAELAGPPGLVKRVFSLSVQPSRDRHSMVPWPADVNTMTAAQIMKWQSDWFDTPQGRLLRPKMTNTVGPTGRMPVKIQAGEVTIEDVTAGRYALEANTSWPVGGVDGGPEQKACVYHEFEVPAIAEGQMDVPLELGKVKVFGDPMEAMISGYRIERADGRDVHLSDYSGKVVLLTVYEWYPVRTYPEVANLTRIYQTYGSHERFVMLGVARGSRADPLVRAQARELALPWPQGYGGDRTWRWFALTGGQGSMMLWNILIGADGKLAAAGLTGDELAQKVEELLATAK